MRRLGIKRRAGRSLVVLVVVAASVFFADRVFAVEYGGFGGRPAYPRADNSRTESIFVHTLNPGQAVDEGISLINNSQEQKTLLVYATDSTPSTGGAFACEQMDESKDEVGTWITLKRTETTLPPSTKEIVPFKISVPTTAGVGEHNGCIVIQEKITQRKTGSGASLSFRTGLRVAITIPGELQRNLEIVDFSISKREDGGFLLTPKVRNTGNVSIDATPKAQTDYFFGLPHATLGGQYPVLRGETSEWNFVLKKPFWGGLYRSALTVAYDKNPGAGVGVESGKGITALRGPAIWFWSAPTIPGLIIEILFLLALMGCGFLLWLHRKRQAWIKNDWAYREVKSGEDIMSLADRHNVSWKLVAKVNKLPPPYALKPGAKIKVPAR